MNTWIDFKELRAKLKFADVLRKYRVELNQKGAQLVGVCPLPKHTDKKSPPSFSVNIERAIFQCFGCGAKGNVLDFAGLMEGIDIRNGAALRTVAAKLQVEVATASVNQTTPVAPKPAPKPEPSSVLPVVVNEPLDFELKGLDANHPYLLNRGFTPETIAYFGLGVASRGSLKGRLAIPLHNAEGQLIGYSGRVIDDSEVMPENPTYTFPATREREGKVLEFRIGNFLYNRHRLLSSMGYLVVVEDLESVWWLHQNGYPKVVALPSLECSDCQAQLLTSLVNSNGKVWILAHESAETTPPLDDLLRKVMGRRFCRWIILPAGKRPTDFSKRELERLHKP